MPAEGGWIYEWSGLIDFKRRFDFTEEPFCEIESKCVCGDPMDDANRGVKVLSEKTGFYDNFLYDGLGPVSIPVYVGILSDEFRDLLQTN